MTANEYRFSTNPKLQGYVPVQPPIYEKTVASSPLSATHRSKILND